MIIVAVLLSTIFTFNSFTLTYLLTGGGPGGATRLYAILAYEYAVQALRYSAGVAVAMTVAPLLFVLILFLGRYMMRREEWPTRATRRPVWRVAMVVLWPVAAAGARRASRCSGSSTTSPRRRRRRSARPVRPARARAPLVSAQRRATRRRTS